MPCLRDVLDEANFSLAHIPIWDAIAEPRRREIIDLLSGGEARPVGELVERLALPQPAVSKHLGVLRRVGIVSVTTSGPLRLYRLEPKGLKPVHDWVKQYEQFWAYQIDGIKQRAEAKPRAKKDR